ncbi:SseB family protein [Clostridium minihomine]|uniref:SseB family protein n=1 Tax=Clostridium minihomine TaxID=2045012 RepID=UPI000C7878CB|nr:SseB family protein [Clostridium minihomine]
MTDINLEQTQPKITSKLQQLIAKYHADQDKQSYREMMEQFRTAGKLWVAKSPTTKNYLLNYVDSVPTAYLFSDKTYYELFEKACKEKNVAVECEETTVPQRLRLFSDLYRSGFEGIEIDKGQVAIRMSLFTVIEKPDFSNLPENKRPIMNPSFMRAANAFLQATEWDQVTDGLKNDLLEEIFSASYLLPMESKGKDVGQVKRRSTGKTVMKKNSELSLPLIRNTEAQHYFPIFSDLHEYVKYDTKRQYKILEVTLEDIKEFIAEADGAVINPFGANIVLNKNMLDEMETLETEK